MTTLSDKAEEYRRWAAHLQEAAAAIPDSAQRAKVYELAEEWLVLAERIEAGMRLQNSEELDGAYEEVLKR